MPHPIQQQPGAAQRREFDNFATLKGKGTRSLEAWFLGPRGENGELLERLVADAVRDQVYWRRNFHPEDPVHISEEIKLSPDYREGVAKLQEGYFGLLAFLKKSVPFFSMRYQGHMNWEVTLPGILGYFAAMLYNPNNVAFEGSTATTLLELLVGDDLCRMLGYQIPQLEAGVPETVPRPWGHITCDGTIANIEAMWAARNLKYYPLALREALAKDPRLAAARSSVKVTPAGMGAMPLVDVDNWQALNLAVDEVLGLPAAISKALGLDEAAGAKLTSDAVNPFSLQTLGFQEFCHRFAPDVPAPVVFVPGTRHYSFPKAAAILGLGASHLRDVAVDVDARLDVEDLRRQLVECATERRPVLLAVAVMGSTEESSVDPLANLLTLRDELRHSYKLDFAIHADAAFGGYHASLVREDFDMPSPPAEFSAADGLAQHSTLSEYCTAQYKVLGQADSITVDPHKSGYIPYPAGALCYRNSLMRSLVTFAAPVVYHGDAEPTVGIYGIEGSKPGAAVAAVYLSHRVIRPSQSGYGQILGRALYGCKRLYARLLEIGDDKPFYAVPLPRIPASIPGADQQEKVSYLRQHVSRVGDTPPPDDIGLHLREIGPDLNILAYAFNFRDALGKDNRNPHLANAFNTAMYRELSLKPLQDVYGQDMIVSTTNLDRKTYGNAFFKDYLSRLSLDDDGTVNEVTVLRSVVMDPWVTATADNRDFIDTLELALTRAATRALASLPTYADPEVA